MSKKKNKKIAKEETQEYKIQDSFYNYEKIFIQLQSALNKCETLSEVKSFERLAEDFKKKDAPKELVKFMNDSIKRKLEGLENIRDIDFGKLKAMTKKY